MTAPEQPRVPAGRPGGGRFASTSCPRVYALLDTLAGSAPEPEDGEVIAEDGSRVTFHVRKCPHGHTRRWADRIDPKTKRPNCRGCHPPHARPTPPRRTTPAG